MSLNAKVGSGRLDAESETFVAIQERGETGKGDAAPLVCCEIAETLGVGANQTTGFTSDICASGMAVRRLTPTECERLQGHPDNSTLIDYRGKPATDGPRYKALGNSMVVNELSWLGQRIQLVEDLCSNANDA